MRYLTPFYINGGLISLFIFLITKSQDWSIVFIVAGWALLAYGLNVGMFFYEFKHQDIVAWFYVAFLFSYALLYLLFPFIYD